jgi:hypothetical protein
MPFATPHLEKLTATLENEKLPAGDRARVEAAIQRYINWIAALDAVTGTPDEIISRMVALLNDYRLFVDVELIFDSQNDFLYRQKGQLKLDNSVIEEFLPRLINERVIPELGALGVTTGPTASFAAAYFNSSLDSPKAGGGLEIRTKNQDFAIAKPLYFRASHDQQFEDAIVRQTYISYVSVECKTNLDKTMFQEACATAHDTKLAVAGARYYLLCEWLDMSPLSTAATDIDEVIILRKAKRLNSNVRSNYASFAKRRELREGYLKFLIDNPLGELMFRRFVGHIRELVSAVQPEEGNVLDLGYF